MRGARLFAVFVPLALASAPLGFGCDAGSCPLLTQSQDSVEPTLDVAFGVGTRF